MKSVKAFLWAYLLLIEIFVVCSNPRLELYENFIQSKKAESLTLRKRIVYQNYQKLRLNHSLKTKNLQNTLLLIGDLNKQRELLQTGSLNDIILYFITCIENPHFSVTFNIEVCQELIDEGDIHLAFLYQLAHRVPRLKSYTDRFLDIFFEKKKSKAFKFVDDEIQREILSEDFRKIKTLELEDILYLIMHSQVYSLHKSFELLTSVLRKKAISEETVTQLVQNAEIEELVGTLILFRPEFFPFVLRKALEYKKSAVLAEIFCFPHYSETDVISVIESSLPTDSKVMILKNVKETDIPLSKSLRICAAKGEYELQNLIISNNLNPETLFVLSVDKEFLKSVINYDPFIIESIFDAALSFGNEILAIELLNYASADVKEKFIDITVDKCNHQVLEKLINDYMSFQSNYEKFKKIEKRNQCMLKFYVHLKWKKLKPTQSLSNAIMDTLSYDIDAADQKTVLEITSTYPLEEYEAIKMSELIQKLGIHDMALPCNENHDSDTDTTESITLFDSDIEIIDSDD
ncbi:hypothetical protein O9G_000011 [Rozella allomycis CSF55]|uniref:Uncharacterized protein n=1 Tax=Rozella allomycis (strain CSF55) TaxID=988480 RepID=A0A075ANP8_ROZAC|nr:hypothetical protein O9G_000011 [Rozella allomycis CSF55]|eukprot:EPZ31535.1 hypothetical protein O9G_000011 [Rozella allomycis CSF55]